MVKILEYLEMIGYDTSPAQINHPMRILVHKGYSATEYGELKLNILKGIESGIIDRMPNGIPNGYAIAKLDFVEKYSKITKKEYHNRYKA